MKAKLKKICCTISGEEECKANDCALVAVAFGMIAAMWLVYLI